MGYWAAFLAAFLETTLLIGLFIPGSTFLLLLGALSAGGYLDIGDLLWFAVVGAILGDNLNYWIGKHYGQKWTKNGIWFLKQEHFERARLFFDAHGAKSVFLGRFVPSIKELSPFVAGTIGMRRGTFMLWNALGGIGWGFEWIGTGFLFARSLDLAQIWISRVGIFLAICLTASLGFWLLKRFFIRNGQQMVHFFFSLRDSISTTIATNSEVQKLIRTHPGFFEFLHRRLDPKTFFGLPATMFGLAFCYILILFGGIVEDIITADTIVSLDKNVAQLVAAFRTPETIRLFVWITNLGVWQVVLPVVLAAIVILWLLRRPLMSLALLVVCCGSTGFCGLGKLAFHRPRPAEAVILQHSYSFPSCHATIAVALYGFLGYLLIRSIRRWKLRVNIFFATALLILSIGLSRIVLGVHYLSDVWSGYLVGALWLIIGISLSEWLLASGKARMNSAKQPASHLISMGLATAVISYCVIFAVNFQPPAAIPQAHVSICILEDIAGFLSAHGLEYSKTILGARQQPISFVMVAEDKKNLLKAFQKAGWLQPDKANLHSGLKLVHEGMNDTTPPLAPSFWNGRINDLAFEKSMDVNHGKSLLTARLWETPYWSDKGQLFFGVTRMYNGIRWRFFHIIDPDIDMARSYLLQTLRKTGLVKENHEIIFVKPMIGEYLTGSSFFTRGKLMIVRLSSETKKHPDPVIIKVPGKKN